MKKKDVMHQVSQARTACEQVNSNLSRTARTYDYDLPGTRDTTDEERARRIIEAVLWAGLTVTRANVALREVKKYAQQNGITQAQIEAVRRSL